MQATIQGFRLSRQQRRFWERQQTERVEPAHVVISIEGDLDAEVLRDALQRVINHHQILHTTYQRPPGLKAPVQVIGRPSTDPQGLLWQTDDWRAKSAAAQHSALDELLGATAAAPFDLEQGPLMRFHLLTLDVAHFWLVIQLPVLVADTLSLGNLALAIHQAYSDSHGGDPGTNDEHSDDLATDDSHGVVDVQYVQFSEWQHSLLDGEDAASGFAFWREQVQQLAPPPRLPFERAATAPGTCIPNARRAILDAPLVHQIEAVASAHETTSANVLLACWLTLLRRLSGVGELAVNHVYDGRSIEMLAPALGLFAQSLPLQLQIAADESFATVLAKVDEATLDGYEWQDYFLWDEHADSLPNSVGFEFNEWLTLPRVNGTAFTIEEQQSFSERFRLHLACAQRDSAERSITARFYYDAAYFDGPAVERIANHFTTLVASAMANPSQPIGQLNLLTAAERAALLVEANATAADYPRDKSLHQLFAEQVARRPQAPAVVCADIQLTYGELNAKANQLAHHLRRQGVTANRCVGLCLDRSAEMIIGLLAILKAGGAYVPLNPEHPRTRLAHQLAETAAAVLVTQSEHLPCLPDFAGEIICLDRDADRWAEESTANPEKHSAASDLVYVIYTSGSTGTPKGVAVTHGNLVNYSYHIGQRLDLFAGEPLHFALVTTITADLGNTSLFPALISGGCLHILGYDIATDGERFAQYLTQHPIDLLKIVPSHLRALLSAQRAGTTSLPRKFLLLGGEAFTRSLREQLVALAPTCRLFNHYGPSETTVGSLMGEVPLAGEWPWPAATVPIGRPIANTQLYILDEYQQPVPNGVAGELYIGGAGVAQGYINQPERTAERFITNPFSDTQPARLYRTGDLVRYLPDGTVEFMGRVDNQIKIRGFRVELEEIETVLANHSGVRQAVVVAHNADLDESAAPATSGTGARLSAYIVPAGAAAPTVEVLMAHARDELPDYMVPAAFVLLDTLPLTANGKVDRAALPTPDQAQIHGSAYVAPTTPTEEILCGIWAQVLEQDRVGIHDNFLELGGHSLLAMTIVARIRGAFQVELPLAELFNRPTVAELAQAIDRTAERGAERQLPPILPVPRERELPLSFAQQRLWFLDQLAPGTSFYNVPVAVRLQGQLDEEALEEAFATILQRHESLRTTFRSVAGKPVQVIAPQLPLRLRREDLRELPAEERVSAARQLATAEAQRPFDLAEGPLYRVALLKLDATDHVVLFTMHHIISDLQSRLVLTREFTALYTAFVDGNPPALPTPTVHYADYAYWQRQWLSGPAYGAQLAWWREALAGSNHVLDLPTDHPRPALQTYNGADEALTLPDELGAALVQLSRREGVSLYMTLLAAFQTLLYRYTGQGDINVGTPVSGRTSAETEGMIGFFLNTLVMRAKLDGNLSFRDLLKQVRTTTLAAYAHQEMPFEQLVEAVQPTRSMSHAPLFQVSFSTITEPNEAVELPGLTLQPFMGESNTAKFDMALLMVEGTNGLTAQLEYNTDLFEPATIRRFLSHFAQLLAGFVANPQMPIGTLPLLAADAEAELLERWSGRAEADSPAVPTIQQQIAAQVAATPHAVALVWGEQQVTYAELDAQATQLAHDLLTRGIVESGDAETIIAVAIERSPAMIVALLGIIKAGGTCLPLDPATPTERQQFILEDSGAKVLLTRGEVEAALAGQDADEIRLPTPSADPERLVYMIYTSGSTGQPKGVGITQRAISDHCRRTSQLYELTSADRLLQFTSFSFDASLEQIFNALITGATLVLPEAEFWSTTAFAQKLLEHELTFINIPTVYWSQLVRTWSAAHAAGQDPLAGSNLRLVIVSGEEMPIATVRQWQRLPTARIRLLNAYGPTETTITATVHDVTAADAERHRMPIGRPTPGKRIYILDPHGNLAPIGVPGEIHIGGAHLARGYHRRPELTAERFIRDRFSERPAARLYRTGDLACWRADGTIEFLGRLDTQVKVRGFRIELGEIEAVLATHPALTDVTVVARQDEEAEGPEHKRLVAYLVAPHATPPSVTELRDFVKRRLPEYMIPAAFVYLDALPLSPSGKVDRNALPAPDAVRPDLADAYLPPRNETETQLVAIAGDLLKLERVGVQDNFFALGGHSLLATQFMARLVEAFDVDLPLRLLFERPTVAAIAEAVEAAKAAGNQESAPPIVARSRAARRVKRSDLAQ